MLIAFDDSTILQEQDTGMGVVEYELLLLEQFLYATFALKQGLGAISDAPVKLAIRLFKQGFLRAQGCLSMANHQQKRDIQEPQNDKDNRSDTPKRTVDLHDQRRHIQIDLEDGNNAILTPNRDIA